jgi:hypothetical protein
MYYRGICLERLKKEIQSACPVSGYRYEPGSSHRPGVFVLDNGYCSGNLFRDEIKGGKKSVLSRDRVTFDGVRIRKRIYLALTGRNYK